MGLYLCIFTEDQEDEVGSCDVGHYSDFGCFRDTIARHMKADDFPVLMAHSDCDGEWTVEQMPELRLFPPSFARFRQNNRREHSSTQPNIAMMPSHFMIVSTT